MVGIDVIVIGFLCVIGLLMLGLHVGTVMVITAMIGVVWGIGPMMLNSAGNLMWGQMNSFVLTAIPLYILMGEILVKSNIAERMYRSLSDWVQWMPGRLLHSNIAASTMFSAISGSSVATAATISTVAFPTFRRHNYDERWVAGSIASGATLGILIPPSINMIIYGAITDTSIGDLFIAGIIPGLTLALFGKGLVPEAMRVAFGTGVLGAFTTFSTFSTELDALLLRGQAVSALLYALGSVGLGLTAAVFGRLLGARL